MNFYYTIVVVKDLYRESLLDEDFPITQITVLIIASCNRVSFMFTNKYNKILGNLAIIGMSSQGLLLFFGFGISTGLLKMIKIK